MHRRNYLMQAIKVNYDNLEDIQIISPKTVFICKKCIIYIRWHRYKNKQWMTSLVNIFPVQYWKERRMSSNILTLSTIMNYTEYDYNSISRETNLENEYANTPNMQIYSWHLHVNCICKDIDECWQNNILHTLQTTHYSYSLNRCI